MRQHTDCKVCTLSFNLAADVITKSDGDNIDPDKKCWGLTSCM